MTPPDLAVFDLDGTLTHKDTFVPFLERVAGRVRTAGAFLRSAPTLVRAARDRDRRDDVKQALVRHTLAGRLLAEVERAAQAHAAAIAATQLRPDTLARLRWHQAQGHDCAIASASLAVYVVPLADHLGVAAVMATDVEIGPDGRLTGRLSGANCRAAEKLRRVRATFGLRPIAWAYGDSVDDAPVLDQAHHPLLVGRDPVAAAGVVTS